MNQPVPPTPRGRARTAALLLLSGAVVATVLTAHLPAAPEPPDRPAVVVEPAR
jgi:hypothetical protein